MRERRLTVLTRFEMRRLMCVPRPMRGGAKMISLDVGIIGIYDIISQRRKSRNDGCDIPEDTDVHFRP